MENRNKYTSYKYMYMHQHMQIARQKSFINTNKQELVLVTSPIDQWD